jgi:hypothetical protein
MRERSAEPDRIADSRAPEEQRYLCNVNAGDFSALTEVKTVWRRIRCTPCDCRARKRRIVRPQGVVADDEEPAPAPVSARPRQFYGHVAAHKELTLQQIPPN